VGIFEGGVGAVDLEVADLGNRRDLSNLKVIRQDEFALREHFAGLVEEDPRTIDQAGAESSRVFGLFVLKLAIIFFFRERG
jgi:hypothetical protein